MKPLFCSDINVDDILLSDNANIIPGALNHLIVNVSKFNVEDKDENNMYIFEDNYILHVEDKKENDVDPFLITRNGYNDINSWKIFMGQYGGNVKIIYCRLFKIFRVMVNYYLRKRFFSNIGKFRKIVIKSSMNLFKDFFRLRKNNDYSVDTLIFNDFIVIPMICFWISFKYNTNDFKMSKYMLQNFSGVSAEYLMKKEMEFLSYIKFDIGKSMIH